MNKSEILKIIGEELQTAPEPIEERERRAEQYGTQFVCVCRVACEYITSAEVERIKAATKCELLAVEAESDGVFVLLLDYNPARP